MFKEDKDTFFITGDTQFAPNQINSYYDEATYIFQDCELAEYPNSVHAQYHQLKSLSESVKQKMYLYHYSLPKDKSFEDINKMAINDGFRGFVRRGEIFDTTKMDKKINNAA